MLSGFSFSFLYFFLDKTRLKARRISRQQALVLVGKKWENLIRPHVRKRHGTAKIVVASLCGGAGAARAARGCNIRRHGGGCNLRRHGAWSGATPGESRNAARTLNIMSRITAVIHYEVIMKSSWAWGRYLTCHTRNLRILLARLTQESANLAGRRCRRGVTE